MKCRSFDFALWASLRMTRFGVREYGSNSNDNGNSNDDGRQRQRQTTATADDGNDNYRDSSLRSE